MLDVDAGVVQDAGVRVVDRRPVRLQVLVPAALAADARDQGAQQGRSQQRWRTSAHHESLPLGRPTSPVGRQVIALRAALQRNASRVEVAPRGIMDPLHLWRREFIGAAALAGMGFAELDRLPQSQVRALRSAVRGRVLVPGNGGYNGARFVFNRRYDGVRPPAVVQVRDGADVRAVVQWAGRFDVPLVTRSGGHAYNGASISNSAVVVDVRRLDGVRLGDGNATVGPGARNIDIYAALARRGATIPSGSCPTVGFGGLSTGGGMGLAGRELGLTIDRVRSYDVVTADGREQTVQGDDELFWALRGGGRSFGIVTAVRLRVRQVRRAAFFRITYPAASRAEALAAWDDLAPGAPAGLTAICTLTSSGAAAFGQYYELRERGAADRRAAHARARRVAEHGHVGLPGAATALGRLRRRRARRLP